MKGSQSRIRLSIQKIIKVECMLKYVEPVKPLIKVQVIWSFTNLFFYAIFLLEQDPSYSTRPNANVTAVTAVPVVISDDDDDNEDEDDEEEDEEEIEYYDRFDRWGRTGMRRWTHTSDEEENSENEDDDY